MSPAEWFAPWVERRFHPAMLLFDAAGRLTEAAGHLEQYGLGALKPGTPVDEIDFLASMLPSAVPLELPLVTTPTGTPRSVLIEPVASGTRVMLLDASHEQALRHRVIQIENQRRLQEEHAVPPAVLARTETALFEQVPRGFRLIAPSPTWLQRLLPPRTVYPLAMLRERLSLLEYFLTLAEAAWERGGDAVEAIKWVEADEAGAEYEIEASAFSGDGRRMLTLSSHTEDYDERQHILQQARLLRLAAERQTKDIEKKDVLLHSIVHDLIGPLGVITGTLAELGADLTDPAKRHMCDIALRQCQRQERMIRDILDVYAADVARLDAFSTNPSTAPKICAVLEEVIESMRPAFTAKRVALKTDAGEVNSGVLVSGEPARLERVFANLLENALRYTPPGHTVTVRLRAHPHYVQAEVLDEGPGIDAQMIPGLFQKFSQGREKAGKIGLGLFFCRITIERWGGSVGAANRPAGGAVFWFRLPLVTIAEEHGQLTTH